jgi:hypothetical protein
VVYTTIQKANAATQCLIRYWLGRSDYMQPWLAIAGTSTSDFVYYSQLAGSPGAYFTGTYTCTTNGVTYAVMTDRPWLPSSASGSGPTLQRANYMPSNTQYLFAPGVVLDYEVADFRTTGVGASAGDPDSSLSFIQSIYTDVHATQDSNGNPQVPALLYLWTDSLNGLSMPSSGLDATNLPTIAANYVDFLSVMLWGGNKEGNVCAAYLDQIGYLKGGNVGGVCSNAVPFDKLVLTIDMSGLGISDAQFAYNLLMQGNTSSPPTAPKAAWFWQDGEAACDTQSNNVVSWVLQGTSSPPTSLTYPTTYGGTIICP